MGFQTVWEAESVKVDGQEACGLCQNVVNPGAVVCANCGAQKVTRHSKLGCGAYIAGAWCLFIAVSSCAGAFGCGGMIVPNRGFVQTVGVLIFGGVFFVMALGAVVFARSTSKEYWIVRPKRFD